MNCGVVGGLVISQEILACDGFEFTNVMSTLRRLQN